MRTKSSKYRIPKLKLKRSIILPLYDQLERRQMNVKAYRITGQSSASWTVCSYWQQQRNIKGLPYCPFVRGIHRWPVDSPHKGDSNTENIAEMYIDHNDQIWWPCVGQKDIGSPIRVSGIRTCVLRLYRKRQVVTEHDITYTLAYIIDCYK